MQLTWIFSLQQPSEMATNFIHFLQMVENGNMERLGEMPKDTEGVWDRNPDKEIAKYTLLITTPQVQTLKLIKYWRNEKIMSTGTTGKYSWSRLFKNGWDIPPPVVWIGAIPSQEHSCKGVYVFEGSEICSPQQLRTWPAFNQWKPTAHLVQTRHKSQSYKKMCCPVSYAIS